MSEEDLQATSPAEEVQQTEAVEKTEEVPGEAVASEESDEQENERVQREAAERAEKKARGVQKRIDELTADKHAERRRADEAAALNAQLMALLQGKTTQSQPTTDEPQREDFDDDVAWLRAVARYDAQQAAKASAEELRKAQEEQRARLTQEESQSKAEAEFVSRRKELEKTLPDYRDVIEDWDDQLPDGVIDTLIRMPDGPLVVYHIAKNPELQLQFINQPSYMHGVLLGQMLATIKTPQKPSSAPAPGKPVRTTAGTSTEPPSDPEQYRAWADKHMR